MEIPQFSALLPNSQQSTSTATGWFTGVPSSSTFSFANSDGVVHKTPSRESYEDIPKENASGRPHRRSADIRRSGARRLGSALNNLSASATRGSLASLGSREGAASPQCVSSTDDSSSDDNRSSPSRSNSANCDYELKSSQESQLSRPRIGLSAKKDLERNRREARASRIADTRPGPFSFRPADTVDGKWNWDEEHDDYTLDPAQVMPGLAAPFKDTRQLAIANASVMIMPLCPARLFKDVELDGGQSSIEFASYIWTRYLNETELELQLELFTILSRMAFQYGFMDQVLIALQDPTRLKILSAPFQFEKPIESFGRARIGPFNEFLTQVLAESDRREGTCQYNWRQFLLSIGLHRWIISQCSEIMSVITEHKSAMTSSAEDKGLLVKFYSLLKVFLDDPAMALQVASIHGIQSFFATSIADIPLVILEPALGSLVSCMRVYEPIRLSFMAIKGEVLAKWMRPALEATLKNIPERLNLFKLQSYVLEFIKFFISEAARNGNYSETICHFLNGPLLGTMLTILHVRSVMDSGNDALVLVIHCIETLSGLVKLPGPVPDTVTLSHLILSKIEFLNAFSDILKNSEQCFTLEHKTAALQIVVQSLNNIVAVRGSSRESIGAYMELVFQARLFMFAFIGLREYYKLDVYGLCWTLLEHGYNGLGHESLEFQHVLHKDLKIHLKTISKTDHAFTNERAIEARGLKIKIADHEFANIRFWNERWD